MAAAPAVFPAAGVVRCYRYRSSGSGFLEDVLAGLARSPKSIPPKYFYDERGARLFEAICELDEYYLTRVELALMRAHAGDIAGLIGPQTELIEFGSGASTKSRLLIEAARPSLYIPVDLAEEQLRRSTDALAADFPWLNICGLIADFAQPIALPDFIGAPVKRRVVYFPGSTIGNFTLEEAQAFLRMTRDLLQTGGMLVIGVDTRKDPAVLHAAYNDAQGITAQFNRNLLHRINRELGADFRVECFRHKAFYDAQGGRIEMHLEALEAQTVHIAGRQFEFAAGETLLTEISCKYGIDEFRALGEQARFHPMDIWTDAAGMFSVHAMMAL